VLGDLYDLVGGSAAGRRSPDDITFFKNAGGGHLDLMTAEAVSSKLERNFFESFTSAIGPSRHPLYRRCGGSAAPRHDEWSVASLTAFHFRVGELAMHEIKYDDYRMMVIRRAGPRAAD
jgi:hypothetical protein